jgi:hypothetical protein
VKPEPELLSRRLTRNRSGEIIFQPERACLCGSGLLSFNGAETHNPPGVGQSLLIEDWLSKTDIYEFLRG